MHTDEKEEEEEEDKDRSPIDLIEHYCFYIHIHHVD